MKKSLLFLLTFWLALQSFAQDDFEYTYEGQTLTYTVIDEAAKTCATKEGANYEPGNEVSGDLIIPETAYDGGRAYSVVVNCTPKVGHKTFGVQFYYETYL